MNDPRILHAAAQWGAEQAQRESENASWLTTAHTICTDAGIAHGPISERMTTLHSRLTAQAQQTTVEEPELPEAEVHVRHGFDRNGSHSMGEYMCECGAFRMQVGDYVCYERCIICFDKYVDSIEN